MSLKINEIFYSIQGESSYMGLPCPNIFAGGHNFHGRYEYVPVESIIKATEVIVGIAQKVGERFK